MVIGVYKFKMFGNSYKDTVENEHQPHLSCSKSITFQKVDMLQKYSIYVPHIMVVTSKKIMNYINLLYIGRAIGRLKSWFRG
jgi:hypothetical protein